MYNYKKQRENIFTEEGQVMFLKIRDKVQELLNKSGAFRMEKVLSVCSGDSWDMLACVDRLVELKEIVEIPQGDVAGQHRIFIAA